jgi:predicted transposase/invertase (TIGR01784 family)
MTSFEENEKKQKYADILSLGGFNAFFGDENNKDEVIKILNEFLPEHRKVAKIRFMPTSHAGPILNVSKEFRYDFMCEDDTGAVFIVELQKYHEKPWFKRCVSYACRAYDKQNRAGKDYDVPPVYLIGLMGTAIDHPNKDLWKNRYISEYTFMEKDTHDLLGETIVIIFAELGNFDKREDECVTRQDRMLYMLKNSGKFDAPPVWSSQEKYDGILAALCIDDYDEDKREKYESDMKDERQLRSQLAAAQEIGEIKGREEGLKEGREQGRTEGRLAVARRMLEAGVSIDQVATFTGLTVDDLAKMND